MGLNIGKFIAKGAGIARDGLGTVNAIKDTLKPFLPPGLVKAIEKFLGFVESPDSLTDLNKFRSTISGKNGLLRTNKFYVEINPPPMMAGAATEIARVIPFLTEATNIPGMSLATSEIRRYGYGPIERKPYAPVFTDQTFTFLGDGTGQIHQFFYSWMNGIVKSDRMPYSSFGVGFNGLKPFEVEYKNQYATEIRITVLDEANKKVIVVNLHEAYPIFLGDVALSWADNDSIMRIPVTFTYYNWSLEEIDLTGLLDGASSGGLSLLQKILKVGSAIQTISTIRKPTGIADVVNVIGNAKIAIGGLSGIFS